jgi:hypothetical protein
MLIQIKNNPLGTCGFAASRQKYSKANEEYSKHFHQRNYRIIGRIDRNMKKNLTLLLLLLLILAPVLGLGGLAVVAVVVKDNRMRIG